MQRNGENAFSRLTTPFLVDFIRTVGAGGEGCVGCWLLGLAGWPAWLMWSGGGSRHVCVMDTRTFRRLNSPAIRHLTSSADCRWPHHMTILQRAPSARIVVLRWKRTLSTQKMVSSSLSTFVLKKMMMKKKWSDRGGDTLLVSSVHMQTPTFSWHQWTLPVPVQMTGGTTIR